MAMQIYNNKLTGIPGRTYTIAADVLAPYIARSSAIMALIEAG